ncbi:MAG: hypothetical protein EU539_05570, partial [Promethearchaeota archaeon]
FRWSVEGWEYKITNKGVNEVFIEIITCPYQAAMSRNPERHDKIKPICLDMCIPFYETITTDFNTNITLRRDKFQGLGDKTCSFHFSIEDEEKSLKEPFNRRKISIEDKLFYFEKNFFTLDGLWIIETENELDWDTALKVDIIVWQRLYQIIFRRVKKYIKIKENSIKELIELLSFIWSCEGYEYKIVKQEGDEAILHMTMCPYKAAMDRNPERHDKIEAICKDMCIPFYEPAIHDFNPRIKLERNKFLGLGDDVCDYHFKLE